MGAMAGNCGQGRPAPADGQLQGVGAKSGRLVQILCRFSISICPCLRKLMMYAQNSDDMEAAMASLSKQVFCFNGHNHVQSIAKHPGPRIGFAFKQLSFFLVCGIGWSRLLRQA